MKHLIALLVSVTIAVPQTPQKPVIDDYHGIKVTDEYRWLENSQDPAVQKWIEDQNEYARSVLEKSKVRETIAARLRDLYSQRPTIYYDFSQREKFFAMKMQPSKNQPVLVMLQSPDDIRSEKVILDPNQLNPDGTTSIHFYVPSLDGRLVAICLTNKGSEEGSVEVYETATGKQVSDIIPRVQYPTAGGSVEWNADGSGIYYTRYPQDNERPKEDLHFYQQVYFHKLGSSVKEDVYAIGKEFPRIAETQLEASADGSHLLASVANGDGGEFAHYLRNASGTWMQITKFSDQIKSVLLGPNRTLYLLSVKNAARGKILSLPMDHPNISNAKIVISESESTIENFLPTATRLYVGEMLGGPSEIAVFSLTGKRLATIPTKPVSAVLIGIHLKEDEILFGSQSYAEPFGWYRFNAETGAVTKTSLSGKSSVSFDDIKVERVFATSKDGTRIPLNIMRPSNMKWDGTHPTILFGYGGYGVNISPAFQRRLRLWMDAGGVYAEANLRGGAEYGEAWHEAGKLTKKQNVFDDFIACANYLIQKKYTSASKLAIEGSSNGGLLMGAVLTQQPETFRAVVSTAGWYDMLRLESSPNGVFNVPELGSVKNPEQFKALYAYSPYHHVKDNTPYPAVLLIAGANDQRVDPMHSRKMAARLQSATTSHLPILLQTHFEIGHGAGSALDARITQDTNVFTFLFDQLGIQP